MNPAAARGVLFSSQLYAQLTAFSSILESSDREMHRSILIQKVIWAFPELYNTWTNILLTPTIFNSISFKNC